MCVLDFLKSPGASCGREILTGMNPALLIVRPRIRPFCDAQKETKVMKIEQKILTSYEIRANIMA